MDTSRPGPDDETGHRCLRELVRDEEGGEDLGQQGHHHQHKTGRGDELLNDFLGDFNIFCCPGDKAGGHQDDPGGGDADAQGPVQQGQADRALQHHLPREDRPHGRQEAIGLVAQAQTTSSSCRRRRRPLRSL